MNRATLGLLILFQIAWTWTLSLYIRLGWVSPLIYLPQMLRDIEYLGAWAFILDFIVFTAICVISITFQALFLPPFTSLSNPTFGEIAMLWKMRRRMNL